MSVAEARQLATQDPYSYLLISESQQESEWLRKHGYPSVTAWEQRSHVLESELRKRVERGDLVAMGLLADRLFEEAGREREAFELIEQASVRGSVFASSLLALKLSDQFERLRESDPAMHPRRVANNRRLIFLKLATAMMLGDRRSAELMSIRAVDVNMGEHAQDLMTMAAQRVTEINAARAAIGLPPLQIEFRP